MVRYESKRNIKDIYNNSMTYTKCVDWDWGNVDSCKNNTPQDTKGWIKCAIGSDPSTTSCSVYTPNQFSCMWGQECYAVTDFSPPKCVADSNWGNQTTTAGNKISKTCPDGSTITATCGQNGEWNNVGNCPQQPAKPNFQAPKTIKDIYNNSMTYTKCTDWPNGDVNTCKNNTPQDTKGWIKCAIGSDPSTTLCSVYTPNQFSCIWGQECYAVTDFSPPKCVADSNWGNQTATAGNKISKTCPDGSTITATCGQNGEWNNVGNCPQQPVKPNFQTPKTIKDIYNNSMTYTKCTDWPNGDVNTCKDNTPQNTKGWIKCAIGSDPSTTSCSVYTPNQFSCSWGQECYAVTDFSPPKCVADSNWGNQTATTGNKISKTCPDGSSITAMCGQNGEWNNVGNCPSPTKLPTTTVSQPTTTVSQPTTTSTTKLPTTTTSTTKLPTTVSTTKLPTTVSQPTTLPNKLPTTTQPKITAKNLSNYYIIIIIAIILMLSSVLFSSVVIIL